MKLEIIYNTENNYYQYPNQAEPQGAYIELDCRSGKLDSSHNGSGNAVPFTVWYGIDQRFSISPWLKVDAINALLDQIAPLCQNVLDGFETHWDGNNWVAKFDKKAQKALEKIEAIVADYGWNENDEFRAFNYDEWFEEICLPNEMKEYSSLEEMETAIDTEVGNDECILFDNRTLEEYIEECIQWFKQSDADNCPHWVKDHFCETFWENDLSVIVHADSLLEVFEDLCDYEYHNMIEQIQNAKIEKKSRFVVSDRGVASIEINHTTKDGSFENGEYCVDIPVSSVCIDTLTPDTIREIIKNNFKERGPKQ